MRVNIGDVILAEYTNYDGERKQALFVVCYHQCYDIRTSDNFTAIKVSTNPNSYQVLLKQEYLQFLQHDSYLNCDKMFQFRESEVMRIVGRLNAYYLNKMSQQMINFVLRSRYEIGMLIGEENLFDLKEEIK